MDQDRKKLISNEQAKLRATYVNGIAIATFALGCLAALIAAGGTIHDFDPGLATGILRFRIDASGASLVISVVCFFHQRVPTLDRQTHAPEPPMTSYLPLLALLVVPVGALTLAVWAFWLTKRAH
ncbi:hypothetical protein [Methylobacterium frigidaeris]|uniref:Uncharacterized protein n=1 Tax=Methylobacterium frigidaeris TaxID=2038277 RepID=A0AA37HE70_9HYPH|nr:hypothetical protein [Methylobacterium frigidaeris]PIK69719.1 hypothetical protein CS379_28425 [Methylobacterium frigidaeris]GJD64187.1 hypothetical protein MPEAHAMD_4363 [Methylobacterium frigidaeris]